MTSDTTSYLSKLSEIQSSNNDYVYVQSPNEPRILINANTRKITIPASLKYVGVERDHNSETLFFEIERYFDNEDLANQICVIHYINAKGSPDVYPVTLKDLSVDGKLIFGWTISNHVTQLKGEVVFAVRFYTLNSDVQTFKYNWNTTTATIIIQEGLDVLETNSVINTDILSKSVTELNIAIDVANATTENLVTETLIIYKPYVNTYSEILTTYKTPELGWTTQTIDTGIRWRWNGTEWTNIGTFSNDIVGDVTQLYTSSKTLVSSINETATQLATKAKLTDLQVERARIDLLKTSASNYYIKCISTDTGALLVVASGAITGQINLTSVTPRLNTYTPVAGDYVRLISQGLTAELVDIRVGEDGITDTSAGTGIRRQFAKINKDLRKVENALGTINGNLVMNETFVKGYVHSSNGIGTKCAYWASANYITVKVKVRGLNYVTCNSDKYRNSFLIYVDDNDIVTGIVKDNQDTTKSGYVYAVVEGSTYMYISLNISDATWFNTYGFVVLEGTNDIATNTVSIIDYPYDSKVYYADDLHMKSGGTVSDLFNKKQDSNTYYCLKDGTGDFTSLVNAINTVGKIMDATLYVGAGTWDIIAELGTTYVESVSSSKRGLYLKNRIHVICSSQALITCKYTGTTASTIEWLSAFNAGVNGFTLENARIETDNVRYSVHDERDSQSDHYKNHYINCNMTHTHGKYVQCIGGGLGLDGHIIVEGCKFTGDARTTGTSLVSWHNSADGYWTNEASKNAQSMIEIKDSYFANDGRIELINFGKSQKISEVLVHGNSFGKAISYINSPTYSPYANIKVTSWSNEVRS